MTMEFRFEKYEGLGNDFLLVDWARDARPDPAWVRTICDRHRGVGGDGIIATGRDAEGLYFVVWNADGTRPEMCGNGIRCAALALRRRGLLGTEVTAIATDAGPHRVELQRVDGARADVRVEMAVPSLVPASLPMTSDEGAPLDGRVVDQPWLVDGRTLRVTAVSMGNPHLVTFDDVGVDRVRLGPRIESDARFPRRVNVEFARLEPDGAIDVDVYERGAGFTEACGTGACAVGVAACVTGRKRFGEVVRVVLPGGPLAIEVRSLEEPVIMSGEARFVFAGSL